MKINIGITVGSHFLALMVILSTASIGTAQEKKPVVEPWKRQVFFGEQHIHTRNAFTAGVGQT